MVLFVNTLPWLQPILDGGIGGPNFMLAFLYTGALVVTGFLLRGFYSEPLNRWLRRRAHPGNRAGRAERNG
jgi:hypothetical protein